VSFTFVPSTALGGSFALADGQTQVFSNVPPGSGYAVGETVPPGWEQLSAVCSDGSPVTNIGLGAGESVTCTFTNRKLATLTIRKITQPDPDPTGTSFAFTPSASLGAGFNLKNGESKSYANVTPGTYSVAEATPATWDQVAATCSDGSTLSEIALAAGESVTCTVTNRLKGLATGAHTIGFWQNKNGQAIIKAGSSSGGTCASATWLRTFAPFQDLGAKSSCNQVASYVTTVIKAATASGASMNAMLKGQSLATALSIYFSDPALGGNPIGAPKPIGPVVVNLKIVCIVLDDPSGNGSCSGTYEDVSTSFGGASTKTILDALKYAASQSNPGGSTWYGNVKAAQRLAKDLFDAVNNAVALGP
jgi:hypothetical protein